MTEMNGKVAIVTGAARGLGRAYAIHLAKHGAQVVAGDVSDCSDTVAEIEDNGGEALGIHLDIAETASCEAMAKATLQRFGRIDALVNNAALYAGLSAAPANKIDEDEWQQVMNVNVTGLWRCAKVVIDPMKEVGGGSIVNIASLAALHGIPNSAHYATSKAAVIGLSRTLARELGRYWIRVNSIGPSAVMTEGTSEFMGDRLERAKEAIAAGQSLRRNLETDDLVGTVLFLASDASKFISGQTIMVDGGTHFL
ncbi:MAG TPA: dehydrogenase [Porticoccaceae bacterium]|nr:dehydrogenase [Porticoccaceae bacterium]